MSFFHVRTSHQEFHIAKESVLHIETPGEHGNPAGWCDDIAACLILTGNVPVGLNREQWKQACEFLGIKPHHYNTGIEVCRSR